MPAFRNAIKLLFYKVWTSALFRQNEPKMKFTYFLTQQICRIRLVKNEV